MAHKLIWRKKQLQTWGLVSVEDFETVVVREDFCEDKKKEARLRHKLELTG